MKRLTARGIALAQALRKEGIPVIESYPGAAQDIMNIPRKRAGLEFLEMGLAEFGVTGPFLKAAVSHDELDAITSAIVGALFWSGKFERLGEEEFGDEGLVIPDLEADATQWSSRRVIGISGSLASGKTTLARLLEKRGFAYGRYSAVIETIVRENGRIPSRDILQMEGDRIHRELGQRWLGRKLLSTLSRHGNLVIDGLRFPEDHAFLVELYGPAFLHIHMSASQADRRDRYIARGGTAEEFALASAHDVEARVEELKGLAHYVYTGSALQEHTISEIVLASSASACR
jgi:dephospho-CoA kinase